VEFAFLPNSKNDYGEKKVQYSHKEKIPLILIIKFVWQIYYTTQKYICKQENKNRE